jgi:hypothetical protein
MARKLQALAEIFGDEFARDFRDPVLFISETLSSPAPLSFYRRDFRLISRYLFLESVYRRRPDFNQDLLNKYSNMIGEKMGQVLLLLSKRRDQTAQLLSVNGFTPDAVYLHPAELFIPVIAPHARSFIRLLVQLDDYYQITGSAALFGVIDGGQRSKAELEGRRAIRSFTALVRNEHIKLRKESLRMRSAPGALLEPELEHAEKLVSEAEGQHDSAPDDLASNVDPAQAHEVLDAIVTSGIAAATAAARKPSSKARATATAPIATAGASAA